METMTAILTPMQMTTIKHTIAADLRAQGVRMTILERAEYLDAFARAALDRKKLAPQFLCCNSRRARLLRAKIHLAARSRVSGYTYR